MKVAELIEKLKLFSGELEVRYVNWEFGDYDLVRGVDLVDDPLAVSTTFDKNKNKMSHVPFVGLD